MIIFPRSLSVRPTKDFWLGLKATGGLNQPCSNSSCEGQLEWERGEGSAFVFEDYMTPGVEMDWSLLSNLGCFYAEGKYSNIYTSTHGWPLHIELF